MGPKKRPIVAERQHRATTKQTTPTTGPPKKKVSTGKNSSASPSGRRSATQTALTTTAKKAATTTPNSPAKKSTNEQQQQSSSKEKDTKEVKETKDNNKEKSKVDKEEKKEKTGRASSRESPKKDNKSSSSAEKPETSSNKSRANEQKDEKAKAINKMLKNLDIKISGFDNILSKEERIAEELKSSISENVKTKSRAAAVKVIATLSNPKPMSAMANKRARQEEKQQTKTEDKEKDKDGEKEKDKPTIEAKKEDNSKDEKKVVVDKEPIVETKKKTAAKKAKIETSQKKAEEKSTTSETKKPDISKDETKKIEEKRESPEISTTPKKRAIAAKATKSTKKTEETKIEQNEEQQKRGEESKMSQISEPLADPPTKNEKDKMNTKNEEKQNQSNKTPKKTPSPKKAKLLAAAQEATATGENECNKEKVIERLDAEKDETLKVSIITIDSNTEVVQMDIEEMPGPSKSSSTKEKEENSNTKEAEKSTAKKSEKKILTEKTSADKPKPSANTANRPTAKYKIISGQSKATKIIAATPKKDKEKEQEKLKKVESVISETKNDSIYDFKSGSEEEENIKMELPTLKNLCEFSDEDKNKSTKNAVLNTPKSTPKRNLEISKKDDKETKLKKLNDEKEEKEKQRAVEKVEKAKVANKEKAENESKETNSSPIDKKPFTKPIKAAPKILRKLFQTKTTTPAGKVVKIVKTIKKGAGGKMPTKIIKKVVAVKTNKPKKKQTGGKTKQESGGEEESSESSTDSDDDKKLIMFGPKRHRMASLNALAKVQCLYENESRTAYELGLSKATQLPPRIRTLDGSDDEKDKEKDKDKEKASKEKSKDDEKASTAAKHKKEAATRNTPDTDKEDSEEEEPEVETKRELRHVPGGRGFGKHWEFDSDEDVVDDDEVIEKTKLKKKKLQKKLSTAQQKKDKEALKEKSKEKKADTADDEEEKDMPKIKRKYTRIKKPIKTLLKAKATIAAEKDKSKDKGHDKKDEQASSADEKDTNAKDKSKNSDKEKAQKLTKLEAKKPPKKRKRLIKEELIGDYKGILARKRMASLNASAIVAATYEVERHFDKNLAYGSYASSSDDLHETGNKKSKEKLAQTKETLKKSSTEDNSNSKVKENTSKDVSVNKGTINVNPSDVTIKESIQKPSANLNEESNDSKYSNKTKETQNTEASTSTTTTAGLRDSLGSGKDVKETSRPTSSSVVIVQDTDVTITGVYVNATTGSSQESYCKMQYRVQSSVTEERVLRPGSTEPPPKSYTPLGALSSMLPPGSGGGVNEGQTSPPPSTQPQSHIHQPPTVCGVNTLTDPLAAAAAGIYHAADLGIHTEHGAPDHPSHVPPPTQAGPPPSYAAAAAAAAAYHAHHISPAHHHQHQYGHPHTSPHHHQYQHGGASGEHVGMHHGPPGQPPPPPPRHYQARTPPHYGPPPQGRCDVGSPPPSYRPASAYPHLPNSAHQQSSAQPLPPPMPPTVGSGVSAFCPPNVMHHHHQQQQQQQQHQTTQQASQQQQQQHDSSGYYQPAGPLISPHVLPPVATGPPPPLANVSLLPVATASAQSGIPSSKKQIPTPLGSDPEHLHPPPPSTASAADSTDSDVLITGGDLTPFRYPPSSAGAPSAHHTATQQHHPQLHPQAHPGSPYQRSMHAAQMHYLTAYPPNYYSPYPGEAMCYSPPAAAYQPYFPTKVYQSGPPHPPPGAYRRYSYYPAGHPPPAELYEQGPPPPQPPSSAQQPQTGGSSPQSLPPSSSVGSTPQSQQQQQPPQPQPSSQGPTGSQLVPAGPAAHAQHLEHYPGPPGYYAGYSPGGGAAGQCYTRSLQTPYMEYPPQCPPQCPCPMQQSCPKNVNTGPHIGSNNGGNVNSHSINANGSGNNNSCNLTALTHHNSSINNSSNNCMTSNSNSIVNGSQNKSSQSMMNSSNMLTNAESSHTSCSSNKINNAMNTSRGPVQNKTTKTANQHAAEKQIEENTKYASLYQQQKTQDSLKTTVKSELKTEEPDCKSQYEDHVVQPPTPPDSYGINEEKSLLIEDEVMDAAIERLEMSRLAAETATSTASTTATPTSPTTVPTTIEAYDLTSPITSTVMSSSQHSGSINCSSSNNNTATNCSTGSHQSLVVGRKARIGKTMAREMVYAAAATNSVATTTPTQTQQLTSQQQQAQHPLIHVRTLPQQNAANNNNYSGAAASSPLTVSNLVPDSFAAETLPLLASIKTEIKAEHIKLEDDEALEAILQQQQHQQHISINSYHHTHQQTQQERQTNELKIKTEPMSVIDSNQNEENEDLIARLCLSRKELESNAEQTKPQTKSLDAVDSSSSKTITMPRPISEGRMRLLRNWQQPPKINCEIDLSTTSDDDVLDLCQSPTTGLNNDGGAKRIKILDFQSGTAQGGKKSSPSSYKNLIKQAEPKAYLCLSRRRIEKRNRYVKLQRKSLANGAANLRRRQITLTELQQERLKLQRRKLIAVEKKRQAMKARKRARNDAARQLLLDAEQASCTSETQIKTEPMERQQTTEIIDLVQDQSSNETTSTATPTAASASKAPVMNLLTNSPKHKIQESPKASPKHAMKPKKTSALPLHLIETIDAVARGYYSEPETRCISTFTSSCEKESTLTTTTTMTTTSMAPSALPLSLAQLTSGRKNATTKVNSVEKRSKSETKKPIKGAQQQTFPTLKALSLPKQTNSTTTSTVTKANSTKQQVEEISSGETSSTAINDPLELPNSTKIKKLKTETKSKTKAKAKIPNKNTKSKAKPKTKEKSTKQGKPRKIGNPNFKTKVPTSAATRAADADDEQVRPQLVANDKSERSTPNNFAILRETNNNEIVEKPITIVENSSQPTMEITLPSSTDPTSSCLSDSDKFLEAPTVDSAKSSIQQEQNSKSAETEQEQTKIDAAASSTAVAVAALPSHSDNAQVFLQPTLPPRILCHSHHYHGKRTRSRAKFGPRKRQKQKHSTVSYELDERLPPAPRSDVIPKWNNGWTWEGEPFQGAVFLNSDDPLVIRTCYPAMRHSEGDIIRTRDCVLLKANEDNELPYVAKVAHLWENPEDGEMMVSLLWYYRPEHTEQGRQTTDSPDEVYASRHRDHNSVACIEDKCYVLTFSEYCRYRRRLRANEEDMEDVTIVPKPAASFYSTQKVPDNTNPELVMFCHRAYEFRTRRLLKMPNKQDYYVVNA